MVSHPPGSSRKEVGAQRKTGDTATDVIEQTGTLAIYSPFPGGF